MKGRGAEARANALAFTETVRGRPRKGATAPGCKARSLRLPDAAWEALEREAAARKMPVHKLLRLIVAQHLYTQRTVPPKQAPSKPRAAAG